MAYDVTSQWDDIHRKLGNYEELPVEKKQSEYTKEAVDKMENYDPFKSKNLDELDEIEDEFDDEFLEQYKAKRLGEIEELKGKPAYGYVKDITRQDYVDNVTEAPKGVYVVMHLYQTYLESCQIVDAAMVVTAKKYPHLKFVRIQADKCIENYPDINLPTIIIYQNGNLLHTAARFDKQYRKITPYSFDMFLQKQNIVERTNTSDDEEAREFKTFTHMAKRKDSIDSDEDERNDKGYSSNKMTFKYV